MSTSEISSSQPSPSHHDSTHHPEQSPDMATPSEREGTPIGPRDVDTAQSSLEVPAEPDVAGTLSPRRNSEDVEALGRDAREDLQKHAKALQDGLLTIFNRIEAVREEHDKLHNNNKFLQKYIGDLMSTSKITATTTTSRGKK